MTRGKVHPPGAAHPPLPAKASVVPAILSPPPRLLHDPDAPLAPSGLQPTPWVRLSLHPAPAAAHQAPPLPHLGGVAAVSIALPPAGSQRPGPAPCLGRAMRTAKMVRDTGLSAMGSRRREESGTVEDAVGAPLAHCLRHSRNRSWNYKLLPARP